MTGAKTKDPLSRWERGRERENKGTELQAVLEQIHRALLAEPPSPQPSP